MGWKQKGLAMVCVGGMGIGVCNANIGPEESVPPRVLRKHTTQAIGSTAVHSRLEAETHTTKPKIRPRNTSTTVSSVVVNNVYPSETIATTTTSSTLPDIAITTSTTLLPPPRGLTKQEEVDNQKIIKTDIKRAADQLGMDLVKPINENKAEVTGPSDFIVAVGSGVCGAILTVIVLDEISDNQARPSKKRELGIAYVGNTNVLRDGNSFTKENYQKTYGEVDHGEPGFDLASGDTASLNVFDPTEPQTVQAALQHIYGTLEVICSNITNANTTTTTHP